MAAIIIDGYNLIGTAHADLARHREALIGSLVEYRRLKHHDITVVFDGWKSGQATETVSVTGGVKVIYSRLGDTADTVIKRIIGEGRIEWIVVSSDRAICDRAWAVGSVPVPAEAFMRAFRRSAPRSAEEEPEEDESVAPPRRGSGRMPSRKERALQRALRKL